MIWLALSSFVGVFLMGFQTRNVAQGMYAWAFPTSIGITGSQLVFVRFASMDDPMLVMLFAGVPAAVGICCSIYAHKKLRSRATIR